MRYAYLAAMLLLAVGCISDPRDPNTWIKKLDDPRASQEAVRTLVRLNDPVAVEPLIALFKTTKDPDQLKAIAHFKDKRAVPLMIASLEYSEDSCDNAATAANALGDTPDPTAVEPLIKAVLKPLPVKTRCNVVKLEGMKSLAKIRDSRAVPALVQVLETPADQQDFYLNQVAATSLGNFADARAVPALIRGLFMTGRGADIFQPCRIALLEIGQPAVKPLIAAMERKDKALEEDAQKYQFRPGIIVRKTALVLGDLRAREAVPALTAELRKPAQGDAWNGVLYALGMIGEKSTTRELTAVLDKGKEPNERVWAAEALNFAGDPAALGSLLQAAKKDKDMKVRAAAAIAFGRLGGAADYAPFVAVANGEKEAKDVFDESVQRLEVAKKCGSSVSCYAAALDDPSLVKQEKAAFMLARMGKSALAPLVKKLTTREAVVRLADLFGLARVADKSSADALKALDAQIDLDRTKPTMRALVDEMRAVRAEITNRS